MDPDSVTTVREAITAGVKDDYVGVWVLPWWFARLAPGMAAEDIKSESLRLLRSMLDARDVRLGDVAKSGQGFNPWPGSAADLVARVDEEWTTLGRTPNIGDIGWLDDGRS